MTIRISRLDDTSGDFNDLNSLEAALEQDAVEEMSPEELEVKAFTEQGIIPARVASSKASTFGLRHAYFDVYKPVNTSTKGVWQLEKDADGNEYIVRADAE
jgi:hypothetical protein